MILNGQILCIFAHPDDESYIVGGTLARATALGAEVTVISVTKGDKGFQHIQDPFEKERLTHIREEEMKNAAHILGVKEIILWDYPDGELDSLGDAEQKLINKLINEIKRINPYLILTFGPDGVSGHRDHIAIGKMAIKTVQQFFCHPERERSEQSKDLPHKRIPAIFGVTIPRELTPYLQNVLASRQKTIAHYNHSHQHNAPTLSQVEQVDISNFTEKKFAAMRAHVSQNPEGLIAAYTSQPEAFWKHEYFLPLLPR